MRSTHVYRRLTWAGIGVALYLGHACSPGRPYEYRSEVSVSADSLLQYYQNGNEVSYLNKLYQPIGERTIIDRVRYWNALADVAETHFDLKRLGASLDSAAVYFATEEAKVHMQTEYADWLHLTGIRYERAQQFDKAYQALALARLMRNDLGLPCADFEYAGRVAYILYQQRRYDLALQYYKMTNLDVDVCHVPKDAFHVKQGALTNIGIAFYRSGMPDSALAYYDKALAYLDEFGLKLDIETEMHHGIVYGNQAQSLAALGRDDEAEAMFQKSIAINMEPGRDISHAVLMMGRLTQFYLDRDRFAEAKPWLDKIRPLIALTTRNEINTVWNESMWRYYEGVGDHAKAHDYLKAFKHLVDSTSAATAVMFKTDVFDAYNKLEYESRMQNIARERDVERSYLGLAVLGFVVMGGVAFAVHRNWKSSRDHVHVLQSLNRTIDGQKAELQALVEELRTRDDEKNQILWMVAHDLRNPIGAIVSLTEFMSEEGDSDAQGEYVQQIRHASQTSLSLIRDILHAANSSKGKRVDVEKKRTDLAALVGRTVGLIRFKAAEKDQNLVYNPDPEPVWAWLDEEQVGRAIGNVVSNAVKFSPVGSEIQVDLQLSVLEATVSVRDSGIGIPPHMREGIFTMFTGMKRVGTAGEQAFGLGLYIAKQVVEQHRGRIWFESNPNGTVFYLSFPLPNDGPPE